jgi:nucleoid-associated protein YgaU
MTRETKIGLLVGLAFIIVIGILLSDHLTSATEPQQAQLAQVAGNVRTGVTVPGENTANPPITVAQAPPPAPVAPQQQVPLKQELTPPKPPVEIVQIGGSGAAGATVAHNQPQPPITVAPPDQTGSTPAPAPQRGEVALGPTAPPQQAPPIAPGAPGSLDSVAKTMGEEVVTLDGQKLEAAPTPTKIAVIQQPPLPAGARQYKAEGGDSVSRMAAKLMGGDTKANRSAIIAANPALQQNANLVIAGRTYVIPASASAPAPAATPIASDPPSTPMPPPAPEVKDTPIVPVAPEHFYIVKAGDTLTRIAVEQLGSPAGVPALMDLNKEILKGKDIIRPNMKLRLPAKPLASAE